MPFLSADVIPVNPQIHANVMRPLCVLNFIFEPLFVHVPSLIKCLDIVNAELIESTLKQIIMCT
jgi:hypothetical protein